MVKVVFLYVTFLPFTVLTAFTVFVGENCGVRKSWRFGSFQTDQSATVPWPWWPLYRVASIFANAVRSARCVGITFGALPPFAHFGVPLMSIITRRP